MKGMSTGLEADDPTVVSAFHSALVNQGSLILVILGLTGIAWVLLRALRLSRGRASQADAPASSSRFPFPEPAARRLLRISFGLLWIFDGLLQGQPKMPLGMGPDVIQPLAAASPAWVQHLDNALVSVWSYHPVAAAAAAVWIQVGIGVWLLAAPRGNWSRLAGLASVLWGLNVWVFGEAFGGIFAPGLTWLFGAPGAAVFYCIAGCLIALRESVWTTPRPGRIVLRGVGLFFIGMAVLQAWPGRGFWQGELKPGVVSGTLTSMVREMSQTPQPHLLASLVSSSGGFIATHGWEVNLFVVIALTAIGVAFLTARPSLVRGGVIAGAVLCLLDWVLIEDLGFFGGVGTDPNSMIPMALVFIAGYVAITRVPVTAVELERACRGQPRRSAHLAEAAVGGSGVCLSLTGSARRACDHGRRRRPAGRRRDRAPRRPDHRRSCRWHPQRGRSSRDFLHAGRPARPAGLAGSAARQDDRAHLPGRRVHLGLPGHRPGVPPRRRHARR